MVMAHDPFESNTTVCYDGQYNQIQPLIIHVAPYSRDMFVYILKKKMKGKMHSPLSIRRRRTYLFIKSLNENKIK